MKNIILAVLMLSSYSASTQIVDDNESDESKFYLQTKQVSQFFRRFNGEENINGQRISSKDKKYRDPKLREKYLSILFDNQNTGMLKELKLEFINDVINQSPSFLDFHKPDFFAEVNTVFKFNGRPQNVILYMILEAEGYGYKWVIDKVHFDPFQRIFKTDSTSKFLHPMSHELYFLNLKKVFEKPDEIVKYTDKEWEPDQLTMFLQEIKRGNMVFQTVRNVRFHFFQIRGWYFELSEFNRSGTNTGWLISSLVKLNSDNDKKLMERYIYNEIK